MAILSTLITESLLSGIFKTIGSTIADSGVRLTKLKGNKIIEAFSNKKIADDYLKSAVHKIFVFRTITKGDRDVYLDEIYYPLRLRKGLGKDRKKVAKISIGDNAKIDSDGCSVIAGLAGQGKTTIMRKLFLEELVRKERLPFFITLRQYDYQKNGCEDILLEHLISNGVDCDRSDVVGILKTKRVILFWDGFDEIVSTQRNKALSMISSVYDRYGCSSVVTTRPDTEITRQPGINIYTVDYLTPEDVSRMVIKIVNNKDASDSILSVLKNKRFLRHTIKTPILVDVLIVTSSSLGDNPNSIGDYYNHLFSALMFRHDLNKNYNREKKSLLSNKTLEECFSFFSFFSLIESNSDFTLDTMQFYFKRAKDAKKIKTNEECICTDIVDGTNLIVRDGYDNYVYIHRSIQEYFAAKCISQFNPEQKKLFLDKYAKLDIRRKQTNMLIMLSYIEPVCFYKLYLIPLLERNNVILENKLVYKSKEEIEQLIDEWMIGFNEDITDIDAFSSFNDGNDSVSSFFRGFFQAAQLKGIEVDDELPSFYIMSNSAELIVKYVKENGSKLFLRGVNKRIIIDEMKWVKVSDIKHIIQGFDENVVTPYYKSYLEAAGKLQGIINEEYIKEIESDSVLKGMLSDMGY
ncbi:NACHT domain-containing protein [Serratia marcescens]|uniref:NACHT domain-containing protein n=1 Tax=Serratia marcescens TaxID=615 RepID=UPI0015914A8B|nr:NACHT domain-containing protein [Serratia marcescens]